MAAEIERLRAEIERLRGEVHATGEEAMPRPTIEILCGVSGSGKSTYVKNRLESGYKGIVVSRDELVMKYGKGRTYHERWNSLDNKRHVMIEQELLGRFHSAIEMRESVMIDMMNLTREARQKWLGKLPDAYRRIIRVMDTSKEDIYERNRGQSKRKFIPLEDLESMLERFEYPQDYEADEIIVQSKSKQGE